MLRLLCINHKLEARRILTTDTARFPNVKPSYISHKNNKVQSVHMIYCVFFLLNVVRFIQNFHFLLVFGQCQETSVVAWTDWIYDSYMCIENHFVAIFTITFTMFLPKSAFSSRKCGTNPLSRMCIRSKIKWNIQ